MEEFKMELADKSGTKTPFLVKDAFAGTIVYPPGGHFGPRIQNDLQLVLLHTGAMNVSIDGVKNQIPVGSVVLLKPGHKETFLFAKEMETWHRWISVTPAYIDEMWLEKLEQLPLYIPISEKMNDLTSLILTIQLDYTQEDSPVLQSLGEAAIWLYISESKKINLHRGHPALLKAKEIISHQYHEDLSLNDIAQVSGVTQEHLIPLFQKYENTTPKKYLWKRRVEAGLELLRNTGLQIEEVAYKVGFKTSYHFARVVKQHVGQTPSQIRKDSWNK